MFPRLAILLSAVSLLCITQPVAAGAPSETTYPPAALQADLRFLRDAIETTHPDPGLFVSREKLRKTYDDVERNLQHPLTRDQAWRALAVLNPVYADAHMFIVDPDWEARTRAHLVAGGALFPYDVQVDVDGQIAIRADLDGRPSPLAGMRIETINGVPAVQVGQALLALMAGETPGLRANLLSRRMWYYYLQVFGTPEQFDMVIAKPSGPVAIRVAGTRQLPVALAATGPNGFEKTYRFELLPNKTALLTVNQFQWPDKDAFYAFTKAAFTRIRAAHVTTLIIDVRGNTGGDDDMWKTGLLAYIADKPYRNASSYVKKVLAGRQSATEKVGEVVNGFGDTWVEPELNNPLHYAGKTYVLVGRLTYSSAVLFSNVVQDFGFAQLVGAAGYARARQTGGVQNIKLPNTGLEITIPRFVVDRPSGERDPAWVHPDIVVPDSPFDARVTVNALLEIIDRAQGSSAATARRQAIR